MAVGEGKGKLLLFGEHSAVYGYPAVGMQLAQGLTIDLDERPSDGRFLPEVEPAAAKMIAEALERLPALCPPSARGEAAAARGLADRGGTRLTVTSIRGDLPMSLGFGSSAAFCTALVRAYAPEVANDQPTLWATAHQLEHIFHGSPSGIDTGLSIFAGASLIRPRITDRAKDASREAAGARLSQAVSDSKSAANSDIPHREAVTLPAASLLVGAVPRERSTAELIAGLSERKRERPSYVEGRMERLGRLAEAGANARDAAELGALADEAHHLLRELGLSIEALDQLVIQLRALGAAGAKLSGAGGGGAFYAVFDDRDTAEAAARHLKKNGLPYLSVEETVQS